MAKSSDAKPATSKKKASGKVGRGTRWTEEQVKLLLDTVSSSKTAKEGFEKVASELGKNVGTVQQKYYNVMRKQGGGRKRRGGGRPRKPTTTPSARRAAAGRSAGGAGPMSDSDLANLSVDDLTELARRVKGEVDRRRRELDAASKLFG